MEAPTDHWIETATGLGATGVEVMVAHVAGRPLQAHRMIPLPQISSDPETLESYADDLDVLLEGERDFLGGSDTPGARRARLSRVHA